MSKMDNHVVLQAEVEMDSWYVHDHPEGAENIVRQELARKIAQMILDEDLAVIMTEAAGPLDETQRFWMRLKVLQE